MASGANNWQPGLLDYFFLAMVAGINLGIAEGHSLMGSRLKVAHLFHTLCMSGFHNHCCQSNRHNVLINARCRGMG